MIALIVIAVCLVIQTLIKLDVAIGEFRCFASTNAMLSRQIKHRRGR